MAQETNTTAGERERIGRILAAAGAGTEGLRDAELDALRADLERLREDAEFEARAREEARRYEAGEARKAERERPRARRRLAREAERTKLPTSARRWAEYQYRKCGKQGKCKACGAGTGHGPYWYLFSRPAPGAPLKSDYDGRYLSAAGAEALAVLEMRREASTRRSKVVSDILSGKHDDALGLSEPFDLSDLDEGRPGWRAIVEELVARWTGKPPEEVFPDDFGPEAVERAREKRLRKEERTRAKAHALRAADDADASPAPEGGYPSRAEAGMAEAEPTA